VLRATLDRMTQGVVMADAAGSVLVVNARARDLLDLPAALAVPEAPLGAVLARIGPPAPAEAAGETGPHVRRTARGATVETLRLALPDGGTLLTCTDVTAQRQAAEAQDAALAAAEAANCAKSDFLANMSHEIRTPMNGILGMTDMLGQSRLDPEQRRICQAVERSANSLLRVLNDILDFSKLEAGRIELEPLPCDLGQLLEDVGALMAAAAAAKGLGLRVATRPAPPVLADGTRLRQILANLLSNAVKFSEAGEVTLSLDATPIGDGEVALAITVRDQGIGIAPPALARLFTRFSQGDASSTRRFGGTGLGLAISRELAQLMGGDIEVESRPGEGSAFTLRLTLPVAALQPAEPEAEAPPDLRPPQALDILVAEDDEINRMVIAGLLDPHGHRVTFATDGDAALQAVQRRGAAEPFDVILMDAMMPGMDGPTATARIRALGGAAGRTPIVALTANAMVGDRERYLAVGMDGYVSKPIDRQELHATLERLLGVHAFGALAPPCAWTPPASPAELPEGLEAELDLLLAGLEAPDAAVPPGDRTA
jgi:signal transduction histidine kinase/CheY-like chemotaxis protein